jgi:hypothetical protein
MPVRQAAPEPLQVPTVTVEPAAWAATPATVAWAELALMAQTAPMPVRPDLMAETAVTAAPEAPEVPVVSAAQPVPEALAAPLAVTPRAETVASAAVPGSAGTAAPG